MASIEEAANRIMSLASDSECTRFAKCTFKSNGSCARCLNSKTHSARRRRRRRRRAPLADTPVRLDAGLSSLYGYVNCSRCRGITTIRVGWYAESTAATAAKPPTADESDAVDPRIFDLMKLVPTRAKFGRKQRRRADAKSETLVATPPSVDGVEQPAGEHSAIPAVAAAVVATVAASEPTSDAIANRRSFDEAGVSDSPDCTVATVPEAGVGRADVVMFDLVEVATSGDAVASTSGEAKSGRSDDAPFSPKEEVVVVVGGEEEGDDIAKPDETADDIAKPDETADSTPEAANAGDDVVAEAKEATASPKIGASGSRDIKMSSPTPREPAIPPKAHRHRVRRKRENESAKSALIAASKPPRAAKRAVCLNCRSDRRVVTGKQTQKVAPVPLPANPSKPPPPSQQHHHHHHVTYGYSDERVCAIVAARCRTYVADPDLYFLGEIAKLPQVLAVITLLSSLVNSSVIKDSYDLLYMMIFILVSLSHNAFYVVI